MENFSENFDKYKLPLKNALVYYVPSFLDTDVADRYLERISTTVKFERKQLEGRMTALHGSAKRYKYALNDSVPEPWTPELAEIKEKIERTTGYDYDVCLSNLYASGKEGFKFHADKEEIGNPVPIASISLGAERKFYFKAKPKELFLATRQTASQLSGETAVPNLPKVEELSIVLEHGSLLIMGPGTHENYIHSLPPDNKIKATRLNLTYRKTRSNNNPCLSTKTVVVNRYKDKYDVYIGRPTKWGNPFVMSSELDRERVIAEYKAWIMARPELLKDLHELKGKRIACSCHPKKCHGDILAELADASPTDQPCEP